MKNQPNKATVKDGLPTADALIEENLGGLELTMDDEMWKFYSDVIRQCMQSYSDQQNAELRERVKELEGTLRDLVDWQNKEVKKRTSFTEVMANARRLLK